MCDHLSNDGISPLLHNKNGLYTWPQSHTFEIAAIGVVHLEFSCLIIWSLICDHLSNDGVSLYYTKDYLWPHAQSHPYKVAAVVCYI